MGGGVHPATSATAGGRGVGRRLCPPAATMQLIVLLPIPEFADFLHQLFGIRTIPEFADLLDQSFGIRTTPEFVDCVD